MTAFTLDDKEWRKTIKTLINILCRLWKAKEERGTGRGGKGISDVLQHLQQRLISCNSLRCQSVFTAVNSVCVKMSVYVCVAQHAVVEGEGSGGLGRPALEETVRTTAPTALRNVFLSLLITSK